MSIKTIFAAALAVALSFGITSCKDDNYLPAEKHEISQKEDFKPYVGPTVRMNASFDVTYNAKKSRDFDLSFKTGEGTGDRRLLQVNWEPGKTYRLLCCLRAKSKEFIDIKGVENNGRSYSTSNAENVDPDAFYFYLNGTVSKVGADKTSATMRISGSFEVPEKWIVDGQPLFNGNNYRVDGYDLHSAKTFAFSDMYFAAYVLSDGCKANTMRQGGKDYLTGKMTFTPSQMFAVSQADDEHPRMKALFGIPFTRVKLQAKGPGAYTFVKFSDPTGEKPYMKGEFYPGVPKQSVNPSFSVKPVGSVLHFELRNRFAQDIRFKKSKMLNCASYFIMGKPVTYNFSPKLDDPSQPTFDKTGATDWTSDAAAGKVNPVAAIGTKYFRFPFDSDPQTESLDESEELPIDYQFLSNKENSKGNAYMGDDDYVYIPSGKSLDLYTFAQVNRNGLGTPAFSVDYCDLDFEILTHDAGWVPVPKKIKTISFRQDYIRGNVSLPPKNSGSDDYDIPFNKFVATKNPDMETLQHTGFPDGTSYKIRLDVKSDLMIAEVGYKWDNVVSNDLLTKNQGLIEIYNPTLDRYSLHDYYLAKLVYPDGSSLGPGTIVGAAFKSEDENYAKNLAYALLCPLVRASGVATSNTYPEISPAGYRGESNSSFIFSPQKQFDKKNRAMYTVVGGASYPQSVDGNKVIIFGGRYFTGSVFESRDAQSVLHDAYGSPVNFVPQELPNLQQFIGIGDGYLNRSAASGGGNSHPYRPHSGNSGVMGRGNGHNTSFTDDHDETLNGWALIKRVDDKASGTSLFYVLDTFGACPLSKTQRGPNDKASSFVQNFGGTEGSAFLFVKNVNISWPQGTSMNTNRPTPVVGPNGYKLSSTNPQWTKFQSHSGNGYNLRVKAPLALGTRYWK